ncbi:MAG: acyl-CoA dehydrogenase family protein, partial [Desulfobulbus sp.]|nr:acyl-CoA dehydrogenase family protein [Desulfobulbus sp.]
MSPPESRTDLKNLTQEQLVRFVESLGQPAFRGRQILAWIYRLKITDFEQMTDLAKEFRAVLATSARMSGFTEAIIERSQDGAVKFSFRLEDGAIIESVLIPEEDRNTLCVSSQAGCAMGCTFCLTGAMGFQRNLTTAEIINQVCGVRDWMRKENRSALTNIVFMGQGFYLQMAGFAGGRVQTAARATGVMQAATEAAVRYAKERKVFGKEIKEYQITRWKIARMAMITQACRQYGYEVARMMDDHKGSMEATM